MGNKQTKPQTAFNYGYGLPPTIEDNDELGGSWLDEELPEWAISPPQKMPDMNPRLWYYPKDKPKKKKKKRKPNDPKTAKTSNN